MLASAVPSRIQLPFANAGTKNTIPVPSQISITPGAASYTDGFPPLTFLPLASGGIPPDGADVNGVLNMITAIQQWQSAGGQFAYNLTFSTAIGGYPAGAILMSSDGLTEWLNLADNNTTDPDGASSANWASIASYGITAVTGLTNTNVTLSATQFKNKIITLAGALTGNVQIIFPTLKSEWKVYNNTTNAFTVTAKTAAGTGVTISQGSMLSVYGDGTNIVDSGLLTPSTGDARYAPIGLRSFLAGCTMSTAGASTTMSIAAGMAADSTNAVLMNLAAIAKTTAAWAVGTNNGGLDTGAIANSTWYLFYLIRRPDTGVTDVVFSTNATTPTLPANYTQYRRIGSGLTNGSAQWVKFVQSGDYFEWDSPITDINVSNPGTGAVTRTLNTPLGIAVLANVTALVAVATTSSGVYLSDLAITAAAPTTATPPLVQVYAYTANSSIAGQVSVPTNTSSQIRSQFNAADASTVLRLSTIGWWDSRGRNA